MGKATAATVKTAKIENSNLAASGWSSVPAAISAVLTIGEVARELRVSKAHVYNILNGKVPGLSPLRAIPLGRRRLILRSTLEDWKAANERITADAMIRSSPEIDTAGA